MTQQRQTVHIVVIFYSPLIHLLSFLEKKEQIICFAEASFISHGEKETINIVLPYFLYPDNAGIAWRWKEIVYYCHPGRWHMKLSLSACFRGTRGMEKREK